MFFSVFNLADTSDFSFMQFSLPMSFRAAQHLSKRPHFRHECFFNSFVCSEKKEKKKKISPLSEILVFDHALFPFLLGPTTVQTGCIRLTTRFIVNCTIKTSGINLCFKNHFVSRASHFCFGELVLCELVTAKFHLPCN